MTGPAALVMIRLNEKGKQAPVERCWKKGIEMTKLRVKFTFPPQEVTEPLIHGLGKDFHVVTNIRRANVTKERGWVILELEGSDEDLQRGIEWVTSKGVRVDPISGDVIDG